MKKIRKVCELTLNLLRTNRETLLSVLETFIYDPLVEWTKDKMVFNNKKKKLLLIIKYKTPSGEVENTQAVDIINKIDSALQGKIGQGLPLSIEGQVHKQIEEAISEKNLSKVFFFSIILLFIYLLDV